MGDENRNGKEEVGNKKDHVPREVETWSEWINQKFEEFRAGKRGSAASISAFGRQFGAGHQVVLAWLEPNSGPPRKPEYLAAIIRAYGKEAYKYLRIPASLIHTTGGLRELSPVEQRVVELLEAQPNDRQESILTVVEALTSKPDEVLAALEKYLLDVGFTRGRE